MILIYNLSGLLLGAAGAVAGIVVAIATGRVGVGLLAMAAVWLAFGWRRTDRTTGVKSSFPALFFIPLPFLAIPLALVAVPVLIVEIVGGRAKAQENDPRAASFQSDEDTLRTAKHGGDTELSRTIAESLAAMAVKEAKAEEYRVFTRVRPEAVLVLVQVPNLKEYKDTARTQLLNFIEGMLMAEDRAAGKAVYIGVKGKLAWGAVRVPPDTTNVGAAVSKSPLYDYYGSKTGLTTAPATVPATGPTTEPTTGPATEPSPPV